MLSAYLEGGVDKALVGVLLGLGVEAVGDEVVDGHLWPRDTWNIKVSLQSLNAGILGFCECV